MEQLGATTAAVASRRLTVRIEESTQEAERLRTEFGEWLDARRAADRRGQYSSQLNALERAVNAVLERTAGDLAAVRPADGAATVYSACGTADGRVVFTRRFWEFFRTRFDQRDDGALRSLLAAADEIVWSCYSQAFLGVGADPLTSPLPYIEPQHSPRALARSAKPPELAADSRDTVLGEAVAVMPIPVIGLPNICTARPWWLIYLVHETGHQVQADLADGALRESFPELLDPVTADPDGPLWRNWSRECFADVVSVLASGCSAARAMWDLEAGDDAALLRPVPGYPPPVVRRALMESIVLASRRCAGATGDAAAREAAEAAEPAIAWARATIAGAQLAEADEPLRRSGARALDDVGAVVGAIIARPLIDGTALPEICGWRSSDEERVTAWTYDFRQPADPFPQYQRESARLAIAGAYSAWTEVAALDDDERAAEQRRLGQTVPSTISQCGEPATRAGREIPRERLERAAAAVVDLVVAQLGDEAP